MDANQIATSYARGTASREELLEMYKQCEDIETTYGYADDNLLHLACQYSHWEAIEYLLGAGLDPNEPNKNDGLPIFALARSASSGSYVIMPGDTYKSTCLMLDARASTLRRDEEDYYCYHHAAKTGNHEFLTALHEKGAALNRTDSDGNTGLHLVAAAAYNYARDLEKMKDALTKKKAGEEPDRHYRATSIEELQRLIQKPARQMENLFQCARVFMDAGIDPEAKNSMLETAHTLAMRNSAKKIAALLDGSFNPDDDDPDAEAKLAAGGMTLHQAVRQRDADAVRAIIQLGADVNEISDQENFHGLTPLATACLTCDTDMAAILLELGADATQKSNTGAPALAYLFTNQIEINLGVVQRITAGKLPRKMLKLMTDHGYDPNSLVDDQENTLLHLAIGSPYGGGGRRDTLKWMVTAELLRLGADVNVRNIAGQTPLMLACVGDYGDMEEIQLSLLEAGADVTAQDQYGNTVLHYAAYNSSDHGAVALTENLYEFGAPQADAVNNEGKSPMDFAQERGYENLVKLLIMKM